MTAIARGCTSTVMNPALHGSITFLPNSLASPSAICYRQEFAVHKSITLSIVSPSRQPCLVHRSPISHFQLHNYNPYERKMSGWQIIKSNRLKYYHHDGAPVVFRLLNNYGCSMQFGYFRYNG